MKKISLFILLSFLFFQSCDSTAQVKTSKMININVEEFKQKMDQPDVVLLDVRTPKETADGKIEGAIEIDIKASDFKEKLQSLDKEKTYLVYCRSGKRSVRACGIMEQEGFHQLYNLKGGYNRWKVENQ